MKALFDTNIVLDYLKGVNEARAEIAFNNDPAISIITRMEVLVGAPPAKEQGIRIFLDKFATISLDDEIAEQAIHIRRKHRLKLADAIIWATAQIHERIFVTRDVKDFPRNEPGIRMPYKL